MIIVLFAQCVQISHIQDGYFQSSRFLFLKCQMAVWRVSHHVRCVPETVDQCAGVGGGEKARQACNLSSGEKSFNEMARLRSVGQKPS